MMPPRQTNRTREMLMRAAAAFLSRESNRTSLITVTGIECAQDLSRVTFLVSVFPTERKEEALGFLMRGRGDLREYIKENVPLYRIPHIEFAFDEESPQNGPVA